MEGSLRVPFIIRWPAQIPAGKVSDEIVHEMDLFPTLAHVAGGKVPSDRAIDGVNQYDFFAGKQQKSNRAADYVQHLAPEQCNTLFQRVEKSRAR